MDGTRRSRSGGRAGHAREQAAQAIRQMPWRIPVNPDRPTEPLPPEGVAAIHDAAMRVLEETGIEIASLKRTVIVIVGVGEWLGAAPLRRARRQELTINPR